MSSTDETGYRFTIRVHNKTVLWFENSISISSNKYTTHNLEISQNAFFVIICGNHKIRQAKKNSLAREKNWSSIFKSENK